MYREKKITLLTKRKKKKREQWGINYEDTIARVICSKSGGIGLFFSDSSWNASATLYIFFFFFLKQSIHEENAARGSPMEETRCGFD